MHVGDHPKKLIEAAQYWAAQGKESGADESQEDLAAFGAPDEIQAQVEALPEDFRVLPENWDTITAWLAVQTQMTKTGLRYEGVEPGLRMAGITLTPKRFEDLQLMEATVIEAFNT
ncbi:MAG: DUF1799 domain-containing protein [gamma proteobacterium endosymbiont of Lamellibrachia anaximandri]|nr:DUF1799 domain-containing protein [gamma proteobacterium endosymbiont of Lamellibrachia anaximandri]